MWYCWNFNRDFFEALQNHGLPPTDLDYNKLMEKLSENKNQKEEIEGLKSQLIKKDRQLNEKEELLRK